MEEVKEILRRIDAREQRIAAEQARNDRRVNRILWSIIIILVVYETVPYVLWFSIGSGLERIKLLPIDRILWFLAIVVGGIILNLALRWYIKRGKVAKDE